VEEKTQTYGLRPDKLAELLNIASQDISHDESMGMETARGKKLKEMLLDVPMTITSSSTGLPVIPEKISCAIGLLVGEPVEDVLLNPKSDLAKLKKIKNYYSALSEQAAKKTDRDPAIAIYYAAIANGLIYHQKKITDLSFSDLECSFTMLSKKPWITEGLLELFSQAAVICKKQPTSIIYDNRENKKMDSKP
jgi:hypothetical protein